MCSDGEVVNGSVWYKRPAECYLEERTINTTHDTQSVGDHILFTVRTTSSLHSQRLPLILQTWLSTVNPSNVVLVTDGHDSVLKYRAHEAGYSSFYSLFKFFIHFIFAIIVTAPPVLHGGNALQILVVSNICASLH